MGLVVFIKKYYWKARNGKWGNLLRYKSRTSSWTAKQGSGRNASRAAGNGSAAQLFAAATLILKSAEIVAKVYQSDQERRPLLVRTCTGI